MLRKRTRSIEKDQRMSHLKMSDSVAEPCFKSENQKGNFFFIVPGLFVGLSQGLSDTDPVRSPTSPLDFRAFSNLSSSSRSPKVAYKSWDTGKVGLSIVESLDNDQQISGKVVRSESTNIFFGPQMRIVSTNCQTITNPFEAPKSFSQNHAIIPYTQIKSPMQKGNSDVVLGIRETPFEEHEPFGKTRSCSLDSCWSFSASDCFADSGSIVSFESCGWEELASQEGSLMVKGSPRSNSFSHAKLNSESVSIGSGYGFAEIVSANEIELSKDYTRVVSHGPNSRTTHIHEDSVLECHTADSSNIYNNEAEESDGILSSTFQYPSDAFLSFCCSCNKKLKGLDVCLYRGERAFCSPDCRSPEILTGGKMEENGKSDRSPKSLSCGGL